MSMFLPEGTGQARPQDGVSSITPASPETTSGDIALMQRVLAAASRNPNLIPSDFMAYVFDYIQTQRLQVPIGQVFGFSQYTANVAPQVATDETRSLVAYGDLATVGPELDGLANGSYLVMWGCSMDIPAGGPAKMGVSVNGTAVDDSSACQTASSALVTVMSWTVAALRNGSNSIVAQYRGDGTNAAHFTNRRLIALRYAN